MSMEIVLRIISCILLAAVLGIWFYIFAKEKKEWRDNISDKINTIFHSMPTYSQVECLNRHDLKDSLIDVLTKENERLTENQDGDFDIGTLLVFNDKKYVIEEIATIDGEDGVLNIKCSEKKPLGRPKKGESK